MAGDARPQVLLGSVYFEEATGDDSQPDIIEVSFVGGAAGTTLNRLTINGDKQQDGLTEGDVFFDTAAGGLGAFRLRRLVDRQRQRLHGQQRDRRRRRLANRFRPERLRRRREARVLRRRRRSAVRRTATTSTSIRSSKAPSFSGRSSSASSRPTGYVDLTLTGTYWDEFDDEFAAADGRDRPDARSAERRVLAARTTTPTARPAPSPTRRRFRSRRSPAGCITTAATTACSIAARSRASAA